MGSDNEKFKQRRTPEALREKDWRTEYGRDRARIIHSAAFRRLQGKTQVMGAGECDFHRTRLTHSLEVSQIGLGLFEGILRRDFIRKKEQFYKDIASFSRPVIASACYAHDIGHPPYGHGGERALHEVMKNNGGFEGNAQTVRILVKLEKYKKSYGINPTRRILLSVLKYPVCFSSYSKKLQRKEKPPKCYYDDEKDAIDWALSIFCKSDLFEFSKLSKNNKPNYKTFDASIMDCADDIAFCAHDLEDIVARELVLEKELMNKLDNFYSEYPEMKKINYSRNDFKKLYTDSYSRKSSIGKLVNFLMVNTKLLARDVFEHPILQYNLIINERIAPFVEFLKKKVTYNMVVDKPEVQMLEKKGKMLISKLWGEFSRDPERLIPRWEEMDGPESNERKICDYIAGMTDAFAAKIYNRLFTPGFGSSKDEL